MHYVIQGHITSQLDRIAIGADAGIFLSVYDKGLGPFARAAQQCHHFPLLTEREFEYVEEVPLAREPMHPDGSFKIDMDDRQYFYAGGPLIPVLEVTYLPPMQGPEAAFPTVYLVMDAFVPQWQQDAGNSSAVWTKDLALADWDAIMVLLDVYCLCGKLVEHPSQCPVYPAQIEVSLSLQGQGMNLGLSDTDPDGNFEIWYRLPAGHSTGSSSAIGIADLHLAASAQDSALQLVGAKQAQPSPSPLKRISKVDLATGTQPNATAEAAHMQPARLRDLPSWGDMHPPLGSLQPEARSYPENYFGHRPTFWTSYPHIAIGDTADRSRAI